MRTTRNTQFLPRPGEVGLVQAALIPSMDVAAVFFPSLVNSCIEGCCKTALVYKMRSWLVVLSSIASLLTSTVNAACYEPAPAFPPPSYDHADALMLEALRRVQDLLVELTSSSKYNTTSFSVQVTSAQSTLWSFYHTAPEQNKTRPGATEVKGDSAYRIASITKTFTTLALLQLHQAGKLDLDDPVINYVPLLSGTLPWKDITLRILASQLSGIPRDWTGSQGDLLTSIPDAWRFGLPPAQHSNSNLPNCSSYSDDYRPCNESDLYQAVNHLQPVFAPNAQSTYSNMAFEILGLVISHVSGIKYEDYIQTYVLDMIGMKGTSFLPPPDKVAVLPKGNAWFWDVDEGIHNPTGGLYSTADDLSIYLRYILTHYNALATGINWLQPHSFALGAGSYYGMPWEIFRESEILDGVPVTFYTKSGGEPGYLSIIVLAPDYNLGFTILIAGQQQEISYLIDEIREKVTVQIIYGAEAMAKLQMEKKYEGKYVFSSSTVDDDMGVMGVTKLNSSLTLRSITNARDRHGLRVQEFISNGTDVLKAFGEVYPQLRDPDTVAQLIPTLLYVDEKHQRGEKWRMLIIPPRNYGPEKKIWENFCITDVDILMYAGNPINEMVMWIGDDGVVDEVEITAFRVRLKREGKGKKQQEEGLLVQDL